MDKIDRNILALLQTEGRISIADLADKVNLSPSPCARRLKRLEEEGYIEDYQANLNKTQIGINMTFLLKSV
ncbi:Lrp/AsnC family transcriptional regulator [Psychromonas sp. KJ10-2]|uniref:Lrp/AsnC family transcriptional regulator n=1 Tax=Psychromonas sp. KJ10-2 TaxID=3391822 RepID=UPI0039B5089C